MTGQFHKQSFAARFGELGDTAEGVFEQVWPYKAERFGLRRPNISMAKLPDFIKHAPDYLTGSALIEVTGFGRDGIVKLKLDKWDALKCWNKEMHTKVFFYDSKRKRWADIDVDSLAAYIKQNVDATETFHDGNIYYAIKADDLPCEWRQVDE